jgi:3-oxoacyl-[acyl-carrier protein] reductase
VTARLGGRVALVTGAGGGIGSAIARRFAGEGARVLVTDVRLDAAEATVREIAESGGEAAATPHDVTSRDAWESAMDAVRAAFGPVDIVVNNAGITRDRTIVKMTDEEWDEVIAVHLRGAFLGCQLALREMAGRGWGRIVNMSSQGALGVFGQANYSSAKAGIVGLTRTVALEGARHGVLANAIAPGTVDTAMLRKVPEDLLEEYRRLVPLARFGEPAEIAAVAAFLASDDAAYLTGQVIHVDGGATVGCG